jgi:hypothetical protein
MGLGMVSLRECDGGVVAGAVGIDGAAMTPRCFKQAPSRRVLQLLFAKIQRIAIMIILNPNIFGYALERVIECVNGDWRFVYDAGPRGYAGLKLECICNDLGETLSDFYRGRRPRVVQAGERNDCVLVRADDGLL